MFDEEFILGGLLDGACDTLAMLGTKEEGAEDQEIESALEKLETSGVLADLGKMSTQRVKRTKQRTGTTTRKARRRTQAERRNSKKIRITLDHGRLGDQVGSVILRMVVYSRRLLWFRRMG
jgi:hypothetical protein